MRYVRNIGMFFVCAAVVSCSSSKDSLERTLAESALYYEQTYSNEFLHIKEASWFDQCMIREGFKIHAPLRAAAPRMLPDTDSVAKIRAFRQTYGYGILYGDLFITKKPPQPIAVAEKASRDVCSSSSSDAIQQVVGRLSPALQTRALLERQVDSTRDVIEARRTWPACMKTQGYTFRDPQDAPDSILTEFLRLRTHNPKLLTPLLRKEINVALADLKCQEKLLEAVSKARDRLFQTVATDVSSLAGVRRDVDARIAEIDRTGVHLPGNKAKNNLSVVDVTPT
jgi:hypothetical protein